MSGDFTDRKKAAGVVVMLFVAWVLAFALFATLAWVLR